MTLVGFYMLRNCKQLAYFDAYYATNISNYAFSGCEALTVLILRSDKVCSLNSYSVFSYTPFASDGTGGTVYVPAELIESYQTASNWAFLYNAGTCNFVAIEGSEYE